MTAMALMNDPNVVSIELDSSHTIQVFSAEKIQNSQTQNEVNTWYQKMVNCLATSPVNFSSVHCYILDSGIINHSEFVPGQIMWDYNAITGKAGSEQEALDNGRGTAVASLVGGKTVGMAKGTILHSVVVIDKDGSTTTSILISALNYVIKNAMKPCVVNMSLSGTYSPTLNLAITKCIANGITVCVAAGNSSVDVSTVSPASTVGALVSASIDINKNVPTWSNYGYNVLSYSPGVDVKSALNDSKDIYYLVSGTSFSAPILAGIVVRYLSLYPNASPKNVFNYCVTSNRMNEVNNPGKNTSNSIAYWNETGKCIM